MYIYITSHIRWCTAGHLNAAIGTSRCPPCVVSQPPSVVPLPPAGPPGPSGSPRWVVGAGGCSPWSPRNQYSIYGDFHKW